MALIDSSKYYKKQVFKHLNLIEYLAEKQFVDPNDALEATTYVLDCLEKESWLKDQFKKKSSYKTFLISVVNNRLRDFFRKKFGRIRPPQWISDQGALWKEIFKKLCVQQMSIMDVEYSLSHIADNEQNQKEINKVIDTILAKVENCRKNNHFRESMDDELPDNDTPYSSLEQEEKNRIALSVYTTIIQNESCSPGINNQLYKKYIKFHKILELSTSERLFLKHIYQTHLSINKAGEMMSWNTNQSHSKFKQIKNRINKALSISGLEKEIIKLIDGQNENK